MNMPPISYDGMANFCPSEMMLNLNGVQFLALAQWYNGKDSLTTWHKAGIQTVLKVTWPANETVNPYWRLRKVHCSKHDELHRELYRRNWETISTQWTWMCHQAPWRRFSTLNAYGSISPRLISLHRAAVKSLDWWVPTFQAKWNHCKDGMAQKIAGNVDPNYHPVEDINTTTNYQLTNYHLTNYHHGPFTGAMTNNDANSGE